MPQSKSNLDNKIDSKTDPFDELSYYLNMIEKSEKKMATQAPSNVIEFTTIESNLFNMFTMYLKLTQKLVISSS